MERAVVHGIACVRGSSGVTVSVPDRPGVAARLFGVVALVGEPVGAVAQYPAATRATLTFTVRTDAVTDVLAALVASGYEPSAESLAAVSLHGASLRSDSAIPAIFLEALARAGVPLRLVSLANHRLTAHCAEALADAAMAALAEAFEVVTGQGFHRSPARELGAPDRDGATPAGSFGRP
ncbi:hypothetical protein [Amycolatopsis sp. PS_44_ISF1]|uniref:hypothetical protein n=1 Tax=Amycolatopsis sp. PS_44_ISF1 TaxID=2974917 RepID=UPI0028DF8761|nr:hypothetical protein [Amycolatopsis sp. PS_44_ISF1]MDT8912918.1 hypothetical protein [Amycolatopsis sp. PS_44_ISF1]